MLKIEISYTTKEDESPEHYGYYDTIVEAKEALNELAKFEKEIKMNNVEKEWIVPVTYEVCGFIKVKAKSAEEACKKVHENPDDYPLPHQTDYIDGSFDVSCNLEEASALSEIYTKNYESGKWGNRMFFASKLGE